MLVLSTGGTLDKYYDSLSGNLLVGPPVVSHILETFSSITYETLCLFQKDSLELSDSDRDLICSACDSSNQKQILITHGTDTMNITAARLQKLMLDKTIILTGAMRPYCIDNTDASLNIGTAVGAMPFLKPGVFISMHGLVLSADRYIKDKHIGRFISI